MVIQTDNSIRKMIASLAATKEAHDQTVRAAKATWTRRCSIWHDSGKGGHRCREPEARGRTGGGAYKQLVFEDSLVIESQRATIRVSELTKDQSNIELQRADGNVKRMDIHSPWRASL